MNNIKGILYALVSSTTFGLIPLFSIPLLRAGVHPLDILVYRLAIASLAMGVIVLLSKRPLRIAGGDAAVVALLGFLYAATSLGLLLSYRYLPSGTATTIHFLYPLVVTLLMSLFFHEKSSVWLVLAAVVSLFGVALLGWGDTGEGDYLRGIATVGATVVTYALYIVCVRQTRAARIDSLVLTFYVLLAGTLMLVCVALATSGLTLVRGHANWLDLALLALLPTVLSNLSLVLAVKRIGSTMTSILGSMEPLTAVIVGVFHFGETFTVDSAVGLSLIILSVIVVIMQSNHRTRVKAITDPPVKHGSGRPVAKE